MNEQMSASRPAPGGRPTEGMTIAVITEDEPYGLADLLDRLFTDQPAWLTITAAVVLDYAPLCGSAAWWRSPWRAIATYGLPTVARLALRYMRVRLARRTRVADVFARQGVPVLFASDPNSPEVLAHLKASGPDLIVSIGVNQLFKTPLCDCARHGALNVHLGLLPHHRGPTPVFWALHDGDADVGVTVHTIAPRIDAGTVVSQMRVPLDERCLETAFGALRRLSVPTLLEALDRLRRGALPASHPSQPVLGYRGAPTRTDVRRFLERGNRFFA